MDTAIADASPTRQLTTAALRAAVAWTRRDSEPGAWRELSRMTGVVCYLLGPGHGSITPLELVYRLSQPLSGLLPSGSGVSSELADLVLLDPSGHLTDQAIEIGCEYTEALFDSWADPARQWLPPWSWQQREQVQRVVYEGLIGLDDEHAYTAARRFLIEHPAGNERSLTERMNENGVPRVAHYDPIPQDRQWSGGAGHWWWPCPVCRWPMRVQDEFVSCGYSHHGARYRLAPGDAGMSGPARLLKLTTRRLPVPGAQPADRARCIDIGVWRFITVPGVPELELERRLLRIDGVSVDMWPGFDRIDLAVRATLGRRWEVDVKDHVEPATIAASPPAARDIVVPDYRRSQVGPLGRMLPDKHVRTVSSFVRHVRRAAGEST